MQAIWLIQFKAVEHMIVEFQRNIIANELFPSHAQEITGLFCKKIGAGAK